MEKECIYKCALASVLQFKPQVARALIEGCGSASNVFQLSNADLLALVGNKDQVNAIKGNEIIEWASGEVEWAADKGVEIIFYGDSSYPKLLEECNDAPLVLYYKGNANLNQDRSVSIVGTRMASSYGRESCYRVIEQFTKSGYNPLIVSGLAYGIDIAAHKAALEFGLNTVAILPNGIDVIYPSLHRDVAKQIVKQGGILTEFPRGVPPLKINFIKRNRIIAGISQGVIVIESRIKGGAMSTAEFANSYNRDIFALPGRLSDTNSYGCNYLISKNIAAIYANETIVPIALGWERDRINAVSLQPNLFSSEIKNKEIILLSLKADFPTGLDSIINMTGLSFNEISFILLELEIEGKITSLGGRGYCLRV